MNGAVRLEPSVGRDSVILKVGVEIVEFFDPLGVLLLVVVLKVAKSPQVCLVVAAGRDVARIEPVNMRLLAQSVPLKLVTMADSCPTSRKAC